MITVTFGPFDVLAFVGAVAGIGALVWQIFTWRRLGHRVRVSSSNALMVHADGVSRNDDQVCVTAFNKGTSAVTITSWGIRVSDNQNAHAVRPHALSDSLPFRLEPGAEGNFYFPSDELREYNARTRFPYGRMRPWVRLATRQTILSRRGVPLKN
jgi:hypothetical protein